MARRLGGEDRRHRSRPARIPLAAGTLLSDLAPCGQGMTHSLRGMSPMTAGPRMAPGQDDDFDLASLGCGASRVIRCGPALRQGTKLSDSSRSAAPAADCWALGAGETARIKLHSRPAD